MLLRDEKKRLFEAIIPDYLNSIVRIFMKTGLRRQELLKLTWEDVNIRNYQLYIRETKTSRSRYHQNQAAPWTHFSEDTAALHNDEPGRKEKRGCLSRRSKWARFVPSLAHEDKGRTPLPTKEFSHLYDLTGVIDDERIGSRRFEFKPANSRL